VFVPPDDPAAWVDALAALAASPTRRGHLAVLAQRRAETFTPERQIADLASSYAAAVSRPVAEPKTVA
jgi:hypothetical protein